MCIMDVRPQATTAHMAQAVLHNADTVASNIAMMLETISARDGVPQPVREHLPHALEMLTDVLRELGGIYATACGHEVPTESAAHAHAHPHGNESVHAVDLTDAPFPAFESDALPGMPSEHVRRV